MRVGQTITRRALVLTVAAIAQQGQRPARAAEGPLVAAAAAEAAAVVLLLMLMLILLLSKESSRLLSLESQVNEHDNQSIIAAAAAAQPEQLPLGPFLPPTFLPPVCFP